MNSPSPPRTTLAQEYSLKKENKKLDHILLAVDASTNSNYAFTWAKERLINPSKHVIYLLSVASVNPQSSMIYSAGLGGGIPWTMLEDMSKEALQEAKKVVLHYHHQLREIFPTDLEIHSLVGQGDPRDEIVDAVDRVQADHLILGTRGIGSLKRTFLGSTGDYCIHHANCPVTIVKPPRGE